jgi:hypothetical protein
VLSAHAWLPLVQIAYAANGALPDVPAMVRGVRASCRAVETFMELMQAFPTAVIDEDYAREFDQKLPGFETEVHGLRFEPAAGGRRNLVDCVTEGVDR